MSGISNPIRDGVQRLGFLPLVRGTATVVNREIGHWVKKGCPAPAPKQVKLDVVRHYAMNSNTPVFIETGTFLGSTVEYVARERVDGKPIECHSIEIDPVIFERARKILKRFKNIHLYLGDSAAKMEEILAVLDRPATFWLDGHYSGGFTGRGDKDTPISAEVEMILAHSIKQHVILIDDARDFNGTAGYPVLSSLLKAFENEPYYRAWVSTDIIRIEPR